MPRSSRTFATSVCVLAATVMGLLTGERLGWAMSCSRLADHYLLTCDKTGCLPLFRAVEDPEPDGCGRSMRIEPFPEWATVPVIEIVKASTRAPERPLVTLVAMEQRYPRAPATEPEFKRTLVPWAKPRVVQHAEGKEEVLAWYLRRCAADAHRRWLLILIGSLPLALSLATFVWLVAGLWRRVPSAQTKMLRWAVTIKLSLSVLGLTFFIPLGSRLLLLLVPVSLGFLLLDLAASVFAQWWWKRSDEREGCPIQ